MTPPDPDTAPWERVKEIVADALERPLDQRGAFLDAACGPDVTLRAEVDSLLPDLDTDQGFLARPATELFDVPAPQPGARVGGYTIRGVIGEGGMGRVYEATQEHPHRTVALKILRPGFLAADAERRFHYEVEALGRLNHPAVARVHEAGVETSSAGHKLSWFAMEKVDGRPLLAAADTLGLSREQRLELFLAICEGVAHAHQRGVIHRDLKPDNVLVDDSGRPHILDFGIARVADPMASAVTTAGEIVGTLAYMSPEQLLGEPDKVDARSDVYALGVVLYRLLTGVAPVEIEGLSLPQVSLRLSEQDPRPAGDVDRSLRGDLETILVTALAREAERRYASVDALAADVRRALADEPIAARPPTTLYQLAKFARRHRGLVTGAGLALAALVVAVIGTSIGLVRAREARVRAEGERELADEARQRAEVERDRASAANSFVNGIFASADPSLDGRDVRVVDLLDTAGRDLDDDASLEPAVRAGMHFTLGNTYRNLSVLEPARRHLTSAAELFEVEDGPLEDTTLEAWGALGEVMAETGDLEGAEQAATRIEQAVAQRDDAPDWARLRPLELRSSIAETAGDLETLERLARELFEGWSELARANPSDIDSLETARNNLAMALLDNGRGAEALELLEAGLAGGEPPTNSVLRDSYLTQRLNLAGALSELGRPAEALEVLEHLEPTLRKRWGPQHAKTLTLENNRATCLQELGRLDEALEIYERHLAYELATLGPDDLELVQTRNNISVLYLMTERFAEAEPMLAAALATLDRSDQDHPVMRVRVEMNLAAALDSLERREEARPVSARVLGSLEQMIGADHAQTLIARNNHALLLMRLGETAEAVALARRNQDLARESRPGHPQNRFPMRMNLGRILAADGQFEEGEAILLEVEAQLAEDPSTRPNQLRRMREVLSEVYQEAGDVPAAARWREAADTPP